MSELTYLQREKKRILKEHKLSSNIKKKALQLTKTQAPILTTYENIFQISSFFQCRSFQYNLCPTFHFEQQYNGSSNLLRFLLEKIKIYLNNLLIY